MMSVDGQRVAYRRLHELAHELCGGRWVAVGGGGYEPVQVVPRAWTHLLAEVDRRARSTARRPATGATSRAAAAASRADQPDRRRRRAAFVPWEGGPGDPDDPVDRAVRRDARGGVPAPRPRALMVRTGEPWADRAARAPRRHPHRRRRRAPRARRTSATPAAWSRAARSTTSASCRGAPGRPTRSMAVMARRCGTLADLARARRRRHDRPRPHAGPARALARAAGQGGGRPASGCWSRPATPPASSSIHLQVAAALRAAGCEVLVAGAGLALGRGRSTRGAAAGRGTSGSSTACTCWPPAASCCTPTSRSRCGRVLAALGRAARTSSSPTTAGPAPPREAGIDTLGMADCNDPALFVAEEEGKPIVTVPLDDNVPPHLYDPLSAFVTDVATPSRDRASPNRVRNECTVRDARPHGYPAHARACPMSPVGKPVTATRAEAVGSA